VDPNQIAFLFWVTISVVFAVVARVIKTDDDYAKMALSFMAGFSLFAAWQASYIVGLLEAVFLAGLELLVVAFVLAIIAMISRRTSVRLEITDVTRSTNLYRKFTTFGELAKYALMGGSNPSCHCHDRQSESEIRKERRKTWEAMLCSFLLT